MLPMKQFITWSYSQVSCWQQCPHRARLQYLEKIPTPTAPALLRGSSIHKEAEDYLTGKTEILSDNLRLLESNFVKLRKREPDVELVWAFDRNWEPCEPFGKDRWLKVILDVHFSTGKTATVIDHKTGKVRSDAHQKQMGLYALAAMIHGAKKVNTELWYLDYGRVAKHSYGEHEVGEMKRQWESVVRFMEADTIFAKKPSPLCGWCPFHNTQHCEF